MVQELSIEESVRLLEVRAQRLFQAQPTPSLDQVIIGLQSVRAILRVERENRTTLEREGIDRGAVGRPELIPPYQTFCVDDEVPDLSMWNGNPHRYGVSLGHSGPRPDGQWVMPWFNGERQEMVIECLAGEQGWILRLNPMLVCSHCDRMDRVLELLSGQVEVRLVPANAQGYPESAIVGPAEILFDEVTR